MCMQLNGVKYILLDTCMCSRTVQSDNECCHRQYSYVMILHVTYFLVFPWHVAHNWFALRWRHNGCDSVSNHQPRECLLRRLIRRTSKKTSKLRVTGLCAGNSPETGEFPAQMASNAENVSIWWRHHGFSRTTDVLCNAETSLFISHENMSGVKQHSELMLPSVM